MFLNDDGEREEEEERVKEEGGGGTGGVRGGGVRIGLESSSLVVEGDVWWEARVGCLFRCHGNRLVFGG